jgi:hypothetical protein
MIRYLKKGDWNQNLNRAFLFYSQKFFLDDMTPGYYHNKLFPLDVHSAAQAIITFSLIAADGETFNKAASSVEWALKNMRDRNGSFYFQRHRFHTVRTPFIRWGQAWMLYAMSVFLSEARARTND